MWLRLTIVALAALLFTARAAAIGVASLQQAGGLIKSLPAAQNGPVLAAEASAEGHWTFLNAAGERFTTASLEELKKVLPTLAPDAVKPGARLVLVLTEDTVFKHRKHLQELPLAREVRTELMVAVDNAVYPLLRRGPRTAERYFAAIRPSLLVELNERHLFDEAVWQLAHTLRRSSIRVLALEPGGAQALSSKPRLDQQTKHPLTDSVEPRALPTAIRALGGQTAIVTARREGDALVFRPPSGPEQSVPFAAVAAAADAADVNLVVLQTANPRQPGTRSWLWQRVSVSRLDDALGRDHLADFLNALGTPQARLLVSTAEAGNGRIQLRAEPLKDDSAPRTGIGEALGELVSNIAGQVVVSGVEASLRNRARQGELDRRLVPWVHSWVQYGYFGLFLLGLAGHGVARRWWAGMWPIEGRETYRNVFGYWSANAVRGLIYVAVFMPLAGLASAPVAVRRYLPGRDRAQPSPV
jgi:hypothetical protein